MKNQVTLTITAEAGKYSEKFNTHQNISHVIRKTMNHYGIDEKLFAQYELLLDDTPLNNSAKIEDLELNSDSMLFLRNKGPIVDGGQLNA